MSWCRWGSDILELAAEMSVFTEGRQAAGEKPSPCLLSACLLSSGLLQSEFREALRGERGLEKGSRRVNLKVMWQFSLMHFVFCIYANAIRDRAM